MGLAIGFILGGGIAFNPLLEIRVIRIWEAAGMKRYAFNPLLEIHTNVSAYETYALRAFNPLLEILYL